MSEQELIQTTIGPFEWKEVNLFFQKFLNGNDLFVGQFNKNGESLEEANHNLLVRISKILPNFKKTTRVLILESGNGSSARFLAEKHGCKIDCVNSDQDQNDFFRKKIKGTEIEGLINIIEGNIETMAYDLDTYNIVWSQDTLWHCQEKNKIFRNVSRALKAEGRFIFTDILKRDFVDLEQFNDYFDPTTPETVNGYRRLANRVDLESVFIKEMPEYLTTFYAKILDGLAADNNNKITDKNGKNRLMTLLKLWKEASENDQLNWGILQFQKRNV